MERLLQLILERLEQIQQYLFSRRGSGSAQSVRLELPERIRVQEPLRVVSDSGSYVSGEVEITNTPLPVSIDNQPVSVAQSGTWSVGITPQPVQVSPSGTWTVRYSSVLFAPINATTSGDTQVVAAVSSRRIVVVAYAVIASATVNIRFRSGTTDITGSMRLVEGGGIAHAYDTGLFQTALNQPLNINLSANATVGGYVVYRTVS